MDICSYISLQLYEFGSDNLTHGPTSTATCELYSLDTISRWQDSEVNAQSPASLCNNFVFYPFLTMKELLEQVKLLPQLHSQYFLQPIKPQYFRFLKAAFILEHYSCSTLEPSYCTTGDIATRIICPHYLFSLSFCPYLIL